MVTAASSVAAEATTKLVAILLPLILPPLAGFSSRDRPFNCPPRKLELWSLKEVGFCKILDFGEESAIAVAIFGLCSTYLSSNCYFGRICLIITCLFGFLFFWTSESREKPVKMLELHKLSRTQQWMIRGCAGDTWRTYIALSWISASQFFVDVRQRGDKYFWHWLALNIT